MTEPLMGEDEWLRLVSNHAPDIAQAEDDRLAQYEGLDAEWVPVDISKYLVPGWEPEPPSLLIRNDGQALFYRKNLNWLHGASGEGKTWVALIAVVQEILARRDVLWVHYEDPEADKLVHRLRLLGVSDDDLLTYFHVVTVSSSMQKAIGQVRYLTSLHSVDLVVIDSVGEAIGADGIDVKKDETFTQWIHATGRQLASDGCTVLAIDHLPMNDSARLDPVGSFRKKAATTGAMFLAESPKPFSKTHPGYVRLTCAKDRSGTFTRGEVAAIIGMNPETTRLKFTVKPPTDKGNQADDGDRPFGDAKVRLLRELRSPIAKPRSRTDWAGVGGSVAQNRRAVQWAIDIGLLVAVDGGEPTRRGAILEAEKTHPEFVDHRPIVEDDLAPE